ncbi:MAG: hypothetical protein F6K31_16190 [Symploca sp. SIO2G7]|nr:hypothetical protein [Symploca sp. SIO2G7]
MDSFVICHLSLVICPLSFVLCHLLFVVCISSRTKVFAFVIIFVNMAETHMAQELALLLHFLT